MLVIELELDEVEVDDELVILLEIIDEVEVDDDERGEYEVMVE